MSESPILSPNDVSSILRIKESTLRKYSLLLESVGYKFQRNNQNQRWYSDTDITSFKKLISLKNSTDMSLKGCAEVVLMWSKGEVVTQPSTVVHNDTERYNDDITELKEMIGQQGNMIDQQNKMIMGLMKKMDEQQKYIDDRLEQRDRNLMAAIRDSQEVKKQLMQIAVAREEKKNEKNGFWSKLFGK